MLAAQNLPRQEWISRCAREIGILVPLHLRADVEDLSPAFVADWAGAIWAETQGEQPPEQAAWHALDDLRAVHTERQRRSA